MTAPRVRGMERQATCTSGQHDVRLCRVSRPAQSSKRAVAAAGSHRLAITASRSHARDAAAATCARIGSKRPAWSQPCSAGSTSALTRCAAGSFSISASHLSRPAKGVLEAKGEQQREGGIEGAVRLGQRGAGGVRADDEPLEHANLLGHFPQLGGACRRVDQLDALVAAALVGGHRRVGRVWRRDVQVVDRVEKKGAGTRLAGGGDDDVRNAERAAAAVAVVERAAAVAALHWLRLAAVPLASRPVDSGQSHGTCPRGKRR